MRCYLVFFSTQINLFAKLNEQKKNAFQHSRGEKRCAKAYKNTHHAFRQYTLYISMQGFIQTEEIKAETAILVGLVTKNQNERKTQEYLDELEFLAETAGAVTVKRFTQKMDGPSSVTYVGKGKLEEIRAYIESEEENEREIGMVIFDDELSAKQLRNIGQALGVKILDRTNLILDIFAMRAQTANAKRK